MRNSVIQVDERTSFSLTSRQSQIRLLSDRLVDAQRPLRILEAIHWQPDVEEQFFARNCRELPPMTRKGYERNPLPFDRRPKLRELRELEHDICRQLGHANACSQMMLQRCREYRRVVELLSSRGTPTFAAVSQGLFGSSGWISRNNSMSLRAIGKLIKQAVTHLAWPESHCNQPLHDAYAAARILSERLRDYFGEGVLFRTKLTPDLTADASAGGATINIRGDAQFTDWEIRLLEVHEGWVHLATTLNGRNQPLCRFLGKNSPSATVTQEGLAVLTEILTGTSHPRRLRRLANRIEAVGMVEAGADFLDVYGFYLEEDETPRSSYQQTHRVFRGGLPCGCGPFTKDLGYSKGLLLLLEYLDRAQRVGQAKQASLLFCGKTCVEEIPNLAQLVEEGIILEPEFVPPPFAAEAVLELWTSVARAVTSSLCGCLQTVGGADLDS
jgi:uncharacterized protein (TIGR02421 family)